MIWNLNTRSGRLSLSKSESPASHPSVTRLFQCGAIESPASRRKMRVLREAVLARGDWPLLYDKLAISDTYSHAKNRNDPRPITLWKMAFLESGFSAVAILGGGWLQSPASDGPPCMGTNCSNNNCSCYIMNNWVCHKNDKISSYSFLVWSLWQKTMIIRRLWWNMASQCRF